MSHNLNQYIMDKYAIPRLLLFAAIFISLVVHFIWSNASLTINDTLTLLGFFLLILLYVGSRITRKRGRHSRKTGFTGK